MEKPKKNRGLGRGLSALMADVAPEHVATDVATGGNAGTERLVGVEQISANPDQPRKDFDQEALDDLSRSIRAKGIIQPLIVRPDPRNRDGFEIVAGERRWRAAQMAQLHSVPVIVREMDDTEVLEVAIIENIQRADLNAVEEALGYRQLTDRFGHTQEQLGEALGKSRSHIANLMRLLTLPDDVQGFIRDGRLSAGHARALITSKDPLSLARKVIKQGLSVRETERLAKSADIKKNVVRKKAEKDADTRALEQDLSANLKLNVVIDHVESTGSGQMVLKYTSLEQLDALCRVLSTSPLDETI